MNKQSIEETIGIMFFLMIIAFILITITHKKEYEYYINGELGKSKDCYQTEEGYCYCKKGDKYIQVDNYYVAE